MASAIVAKSQTLPAQDELARFIAQANQVPLLTEEEEFSLAKRHQEEGDLQAAQTLVMSHFRFVVRIVRGYMGYGLPASDLIQEGTIGLMKAVKRFDHTKGVRLAAFASYWIKSEVHDFVIKNWRIVKMATTKAQRKLFFNLRRHKQDIGWFSDDEIKAIAEELSVTEKDVRQMEARIHGYDVSFDGPEQEDEPAQPVAPSHYLMAPDKDPSEQVANREQSTQQSHDLASALVTLDSRSRDIVEARWLTDDKKTLKDLSVKHGVSIERIRQIEQQALASLRHQMEVSE